MKLAGVTVLFNPDEKVESNIKSYIDELDILYVVDNTPKVDNKKNFCFNKKIVYIPNKKNLGIAKALNIGATHALKEKCDWLLTMDQDSRFEKKSLKKMLEYICKNMNKAKFDKVGIISPFHRTVQNKDIKPKGIEKPLIVMTSGNLVNLKVYKEINGFKDWLFIDAVDFDFCLNMRKNGYEIIQLNSCILNHELGNTEKKSFFGKIMYVSNHSAFRRYFIVRNRYYICDMYKKDFPIYCKAEKNMTKHEILRIVLYEKDKKNKLREMYRGYKDYKNGIKGGYHGEM